MSAPTLIASHTGFPISSTAALEHIWTLGGLSPAAMPYARLDGAEPTLPSSFAVSTAAQASIAAAALAAAELRHVRGHTRQAIGVDMRHASAECSNYMRIDGVVPEVWDKLSGIYACGDDGKGGWVRIHTNFRHHRDGALRLLGCPIGEDTTRDQVTAALRSWNAHDFESAAAQAGLVVAAVRSFDEWDRHRQGQAVAKLPLLTFEKIGEADPIALPALDADSRPLTGVRCLELTRILAGPVGGRTLAAYGADVLLVNSPNLPNIEAIAETSRGKLSTHLDLLTEECKRDFGRLLGQTHVMLQGYRPGGLERLGFGAEQAARIRPGIVYVSLSAYGHVGPWSDRRGFDSLVQTATGFNHAEALAAGSQSPKALPVQILDHASGYLMAFGAAAALVRQQREGGSWHVRVSLAQTGHWLRGLGRQKDGLKAKKLQFDDLLEAYDSGFGRLVAVGHSAQFSQTPAKWTRPSMPPGSHAPDF